MEWTEFFQKIVFKLRGTQFASMRRKVWLRLLGARIGKNTRLGHTWVTWPHNVTLGDSCIVEDGVIFKIDGPWMPGLLISIGDNVFIGSGVEFNVKDGIKVGHGSLIASGVRLIDHDHGLLAGEPIRTQPCPSAVIEIGEDCWIGANCVITAGVSIGNGAVVGAGAVVTKRIPCNEIWAGVPAKKIGSRNCVRAVL